MGKICMEMHKKLRLRDALMVLVALSASANSQEAAVDKETIDEIIVTATKRETSLMETAVAVSAFGQESLDNQGVKTCLISAIGSQYADRTVTN